MPNAWQIAEQLVWSADSGEVRLYDANEGTFQTLNATGTAIWALVLDGLDTDAIATRLADDYSDGDARERELIDRDVRGFIDSLVEQRILSPADERG